MGLVPGGESCGNSGRSIHKRVVCPGAGATYLDPCRDITSQPRAARTVAKVRNADVGATDHGTTAEQSLARTPLRGCAAPTEASR